eukprot:GFUD01009594.1.p1 GENE.GFUD01009594.1~~GFUD01009594.1.p1  ORF type:complete len:558 (-),score=154.47 GFUD01009594.1:168-1682(-)
MGAKILNSKVEPIVQGALSTLSLGKKAFKFTRIELGQAKPTISNIRTHKTAKGFDRITVDCDLVYLGDSDIQVSILGVSSGVRNVQVAGRARIVLTPTISELPLVGGVQFFFLTKPEIDFDFDGAAKIATKLPAIKTKIKEDLLEDMSKEIVFPNRVTLPLSWTADPQLIWQPQLTGILGVRLRTVSGLPKKGSGGVRSWVGQDKPDAYATIGIGGDERTTVVAKNTVQHTWEEWYEFPLEEVDGHVVEVNMYDRDKASSDEFLGYAAIDIKTFSQIKHLYNRGTAPAKQGQAAKQTRPSRGQTLTDTVRGQTLFVSQPIQTRLVEATLESVAGRKTKYAKITGKIGVELAWQPLVPTPGRDTARLFPGSTAAILSVFIYSANNLAKYAGASPTPIPVGHLPSAKATVTVANYTQTTGVSKDSQQAEFKQGFVFKLGKDWKTQTLKIRVDDTEKSVSSFGSKSWKLSELVGVDIKQEIVSLDTKIASQTITVSASIRFPGIPTN